MQMGCCCGSRSCALFAQRSAKVCVCSNVRSCRVIHSSSATSFVASLCLLFASHVFPVPSSVFFLLPVLPALRQRLLRVHVSAMTENVVSMVRNQHTHIAEHVHFRRGRNLQPRTHLMMVSACTITCGRSGELQRSVQCQSRQLTNAASEPLLLRHTSATTEHFHLKSQRRAEQEPPQACGTSRLFHRPVDPEHLLQFCACHDLVKVGKWHHVVPAW